ncbi:MAG: FAD-binding protein [Peptococcaceae bacterium]|nr:FAD-binding protein [Peptococcaceae bacterium]
MTAEANLLLKQFAELLGADNISIAGEDLVVRPASAGETAAAVKLAHKENIRIVPAGYVVGPAVRPAPGRKIILSLERMNRISLFDRQSLFMAVEPAVAAEEIVKIAAEHGVYFPGKHCRHQKPTIGEKWLPALLREIRTSNAVLSALPGWKWPSWMAVRLP